LSRVLPNVSGCGEKIDGCPIPQERQRRENTILMLSLSKHAPRDSSFDKLRMRMELDCDNAMPAWHEISV
jgi:hypothetical protein